MTGIAVSAFPERARGCLDFPCPQRDAAVGELSAAAQSAAPVYPFFRVKGKEDGGLPGGGSALRLVKVRTAPAGPQGSDQRRRGAAGISDPDICPERLRRLAAVGENAVFHRHRAGVKLRVAAENHGAGGWVDGIHVKRRIGGNAEAAALPHGVAGDAVVAAEDFARQVREIAGHAAFRTAGALGSDAAIEAADLVLMDDDLGKLPTAVRLSRRVMRIVRENIIIALGVKALILALGALGITGMWAAAFGDAGVMLIAALNALRAMKRQ